MSFTFIGKIAIILYTMIQSFLTSFNRWYEMLKYCQILWINPINPIENMLDLLYNILGIKSSKDVAKTVLKHF